MKNSQTRNNDKDTFSYRLRTLLTENEKSVNQLAEILEIDQSNFNKRLNNEAPTLKEVAGCADYFKVSVDWLLGRSEIREVGGTSERIQFSQKEISDFVYYLIMSEKARIIPVSVSEKVVYEKVGETEEGEEIWLPQKKQGGALLDIVFPKVLESR